MSVNIMFLGSLNVGKTTLLQSYFNGKFTSNEHSTLGIDIKKKKIDENVIIEYWDTAGQEKYNTITKQYIQKGDGFIIVIDNHMLDKNVEEEIQFWLDEILKYNKNEIQNTIWIVVNNKDDEKISQENEVRTKIAEVVINKILSNKEQNTQQFNKDKNIIFINGLKEGNLEGLNTLYNNITEEAKKIANLSLKRRQSVTNEKQNTNFNCPC